MDKLILLIFLCFLVYFNSFNGAFISDDIGGIVNNPLVHFSKTNPIPWHLINVSLHCIATILVFYFLKKFFKPLTSLLGASLFAIHPVHTEAVSWVSGQPYIILALFALGIYFLYQHKRLYPIAFILFVYYSIGSPQSCIFITGFLILTTLVFKEKWLKLIPFISVIPVMIFFHRGDLHHRIALIAQDVGKQWNNPIYNMAYSLTEHLKLLIYPANLTLYHEPYNALTLNIYRILAILTLPLIYLSFIFKKSKAVFLAIGIFVLFLVFTFSPVTVSWLVAERYLYFPVISLSLILCFLYERFESRKALIVFIAIIAIYGARTIARNEDWKTPNRFWRTTAEVSSLSPRAHNTLGDIYMKEKNIEMAAYEFARAIQVDPNFAEAYYNLAQLYKIKGDVENSEKLYNQAFTLKPSLRDIKR